MNEDQMLNDLDRRARTAGADINTRAASRPVPDFDPDRVPTVPIAPSTSSTSSRVRGPFLAAAAAAVVALLAAGLWFGTRDGDGGDDQADKVISGSIRPYLPTVVPDGMALIGVAESDGSARAAMTSGQLGPLQTFGPAVDDPRLAVFAIAEPTFDSGSDRGYDDGSGATGTDCVELLEEGHGIDVCDADGSGDPETIPGVEEIQVGDRTGRIQTTEGLPGMVLEVAVGAAGDGPVLNLYTRDGDVDLLIDAALSATIEGLDVSVAEDGLPNGWRLLDTDPDGFSTISPYAAVRGYPPTRSTSGYYLDDTQARSLAVMSLARPASSLHTMRLFTESVETVTVRGHEALVGMFPAAGTDGEGMSTEWGDAWMVQWVEGPGEMLWVGGLGLTREEVLAAAESLEPVESGRWAELLEATSLGDLQPDGSGAGEPVVEIGRGLFADGTAWVLRAADSGTETLQLSVAVAGGSSESIFGAVGTAIGPDGEVIEAEPDPFRIASVLEKGGRRFSYGFVAPETDRVELRRSDGTAIAEAHLVIADDGRTAWVAELESGAASVVALAADGTELGATPVGRDGQSAPDPLLPGAVQDTIPAPSPGPTTTPGG